MTSLAGKYLYTGGTAPVRTGATEVEPFRDGVAYFAAVDAAMARAAGPGDGIYILSWRLNPNFDMQGRTGTSAVPLVRLLADKQHAGVDVRVVMTTGRILGDPMVAYVAANPFTDNVVAAAILRTQPGPGGAPPPLAGRVLLDWTGSPIGSHHQKAVVVVSKEGKQVDGFAGGMDYWMYRLDEAPHTMRWKDKGGNPFGWHDMAVRLHGQAAVDLFGEVKQRWQEAATQPPARHYVLLPSPGPLPVPLPVPIGDLFNPPPIVAWSAPTPAPIPVSFPQQDVQVLRSRYRLKYSYPLAKDVPWTGPPGLTGGIYEVRDTLRKAVGAAERFVYIEDQFLGEARIAGRAPTETPEGSPFSLFAEIQAVAMKGTVKLIFVGSGQSDPDDLSAGQKNLTIEQAGDIKRYLVDPLTAAGIDPKTRLAVWRLKPAAVHAKMMIIDDRFLAIGSANLHRRSMSGEDAELHVAVVDEATLVRDFRISLWSEHFNITSSIPAMVDWETAIGLFRAAWLPAWAPGYWQSPNVPPGYAMDPHLLDFVGPT